MVGSGRQHPSQWRLMMLPAARKSSHSSSLDDLELESSLSLGFYQSLSCCCCCCCSLRPATAVVPVAVDASKCGGVCGWGMKGWMSDLVLRNRNRVDRLDAGWGCSGAFRTRRSALLFLSRRIESACQLGGTKKQGRGLWGRGGWWGWVVGERGGTGGWKQFEKLCLFTWRL